MFDRRRTLKVMGTVASDLRKCIKDRNIDMAEMRKYIEFYRGWRPTQSPGDGARAAMQMQEIYDRLSRNEKLLVVSDHHEIKLL